MTRFESARGCMSRIVACILFIMCLPIFAIYFILALTMPMIKVGRLREGGPIRCWIHKDAIHSDYVFESSLWADVFDLSGDFVKIGWGDRKIFLETPTWDDLKIEDFMRAFFGLNKTVLRVESLYDVPARERFLDMTDEQFKKLKRHVMDSTNGIAIKKIKGYYQKGDFYESEFKYNCFTNCNNWVGSGLRKAGLANRIWFPLTIWI